jgi:hypothetical protein
MPQTPTAAPEAAPFAALQLALATLQTLPRIDQLSECYGHFLLHLEDLAADLQASRGSFETLAKDWEDLSPL